MIVDLDCMDQPLEIGLEQLRTTFPSSDLFALSSTDSSQLALQCIRSGFTDFLLKPASPEEFSWRIRKSQQRHELFPETRRPSDGHAESGYADFILQYARDGRAEHPRVFANLFQQLRRGVGEMGFQKEPQVICSIPKRIPAAKILSSVAPRESWGKKRPLILRAKDKESRKIILPCQDLGNGGIFIWGVLQPVTTQELADARETEPAGSGARLKAGQRPSLC